MTISNGILENFEEVALSKFSNLDILLLTHILNPLVCLALRIDDQRPSSTIEYENAIIDGQLICRQTILLPISNLHFLSQDSGELIV